jgi:hydroxyacylglutathione hydrolase
LQYTVKTISRGPAGSNCYICSYGAKAFIIDPGCATHHIVNYINENKLEVIYIFLTHAHYDHTARLDEIRKIYPGAPVYAHKTESDILCDPYLNGSVLFGASICIAKADRYYNDGDKVGSCGDDIRIMHTPGHTQGSVCIIAGDNIFTGDTLFRGGIGRYDLPGGDRSALLSSLCRIIGLDGDCRIYPGHGNASTIKNEKENNPFLAEDIW